MHHQGSPHAISSLSFISTVLESQFIDYIFSIVSSAYKCIFAFDRILLLLWLAPCLIRQGMWRDLNPPGCVLGIWQELSSDLQLKDGVVCTNLAQLPAGTHQSLCFTRWILTISAPKALLSQSISEENTHPHVPFILLPLCVVLGDVILESI